MLRSTSMLLAAFPLRAVSIVCRTYVAGKDLVVRCLPAPRQRSWRPTLTMSARCPSPRRAFRQM